MSYYDSYVRWMYRGGRPNRLAMLLNRMSAIAFSAGFLPKRVATLDVRGRRSGRVISFPVVIADHEGERYLVAMLGEKTNWVRNVRAAGCRAVLHHGPRDEWVLAQACRQTAAWRATDVPDLRISVNISGAPLRSGGLHELVVAILRRSGLPATALEVEVTEKVAATEGDAALATLIRLRALGVRVAIDDFGTGYSSLSRLRTLPADIVKIDQSFVSEIVDRKSAVPLVTSTINMAHGLGLQVVAEGIETPHQLAFLTEKGCEIGQGYLLGRPVPAHQLHPGRPQWAPTAESVPAG